MARFDISTHSHSDEGEITIEVRCPIVRGKLMFPRARIDRTGGGEIPECWTATRIEGTLESLLSIHKSKVQWMEIQGREERKRVVFDASAQELSDSLSVAASKFIEARKDFLGSPLDCLPDFLRACGDAFAKASNNG